MQGTPRAYDQSAEAKGQDPEGPSDVWFLNPEKHGLLESGSITRGVSHLLYQRVSGFGYGDHIFLAGCGPVPFIPAARKLCRNGRMHFPLSCTI